MSAPSEVKTFSCLEITGEANAQTTRTKELNAKILAIIANIFLPFPFHSKDFPFQSERTAGKEILEKTFSHLRKYKRGINNKSKKAAGF
jgi:hypothetical protein